MAAMEKTIERLSSANLALVSLSKRSEVLMGSCGVPRNTTPLVPHLHGYDRRIFTALHP